MRLLFLFDIDGTLLNTGGAGFFALRDGFCEAFDSDPSLFPKLNLHGATDRGVAMGLFEQFEIAHTPENEIRFFDAYHGHLERNLTLESGSVAIPGVIDLLDVLRDETDHAVGLLTGNISRGAYTKVDAFGIGRERFPFGAFGDDHHDRNELGPIGISRASDLTGHRFTSESTIIIGDTPKDIACARACGAKAVAVTTGGFDEEQLAKFSPDLLLHDLADSLDSMESLGRS